MVSRPASPYYDYENREGFSCSVKRARLLVEEEYEKRLSGPNVAGAIFALKNHGWSDRHDHARMELPVKVADMTNEELRRIVAGEDPTTVMLGRLTDQAVTIYLPHNGRDEPPKAIRELPKAIRERMGGNHGAGG